MQEIAEQFGDSKVQIIIGVGSCGTFAGTILGCKLFFSNARVMGISVSRTADAIRKRTAEIISESAQLINCAIEANSLPVECYDSYFTEYGLMTKECEQAILDCAFLEGILLDPVYTGKVLAGLTGLVENNTIDSTIPVIFIHTGGTPIIFSFESELGNHANITKIRKQQ